MRQEDNSSSRVIAYQRMQRPLLQGSQPNLVNNNTEDQEEQEGTNMTGPSPDEDILQPEAEGKCGSNSRSRTCQLTMIAACFSRAGCSVVLLEIKYNCRRKRQLRRKDTYFFCHHAALHCRLAAVPTTMDAAASATQEHEKLACPRSG